MAESLSRFLRSDRYDKENQRAHLHQQSLRPQGLVLANVTEALREQLGMGLGLELPKPHDEPHPPVAGWGFDAVKWILQNPVYIGVFRLNVSTQTCSDSALLSLCFRELCFRLRECGLGFFKLCLSTVEFGGVRPRIDDDQHVAFVDQRPFLEVHLVHVTRYARSDLDGIDGGSSGGEVGIVDDSRSTG